MKQKKACHKASEALRQATKVNLDVTNLLLF